MNITGLAGRAINTRRTTESPHNPMAVIISTAPMLLISTFSLSLSAQSGNNTVVVLLVLALAFFVMEI